MTIEKSPENDSIKQYIILKHCILAGLTPLIPLPLVDDWVKTYLLRRQVRKLAALHQTELDPEAIKVLADEPETGCLASCLGMLLVLPFKLLFRKIFFFLEWKRALDTLSRTYHRGYLIECALDEGWCRREGEYTAAQIRSAIDVVCQKVRTDPIEHALASTFRKSQNLVKSVAKGLFNRFRQLGNPTQDRVTSELEAIQVQNEPELKNLIERFQEALQNVPAVHFQKTRQLLADELQQIKRASELKLNE